MCACSLQRETAVRNGLAAASKKKSTMLQRGKLLPEIVVILTIRVKIDIVRR